MNNILTTIKSYKSKGDSTLPPFPVEGKDKVEDDLEMGLSSKKENDEKQPYRTVKFLVYIRDYFKK